MAFFSKNDTNGSHHLLLDQIDFLKAQVEKLEAEKNKLLDALLSIQAPEAYKEMKLDEAKLQAMAFAPSKEEMQKKELSERTQTRWIEQLESPLFGTAEDMERWMNGNRGPIQDSDVELSSVHQNDES